MKILIIGGNGMAGHMIRNFLKQVRRDEIIYIHRTANAPDGIFLDCTKEEELKALILKEKPDVVINAAGILNKKAQEQIVESIKINSLLPHQLVEWLDECNGRLIHISTDCVFSGNKGAYKENDDKDSGSVYGQTKALGEVDRPGHLTIRTSIIGPELKQGIGLFQWLMTQEKQVYGYTRTMWNGVTTLELAQFISNTIDEPRDGLYHLTSEEPISKYTLLKQINEIFNKNLLILKDEEIKLDRTLINTRKDIRYNNKSIRRMLIELRVWMTCHGLL